MHQEFVGCRHPESGGIREAIEKRLSFISPTTSAVEVPLRGFDVGEDITKEVATAWGPTEVLTVVDKTTVPTPDQVEAANVTSAEVSLANEALPQLNIPFDTEATTSTRSEPTSTQPDTEGPSLDLTGLSSTPPGPPPPLSSLA